MVIYILLCSGGVIGCSVGYARLTVAVWELILGLRIVRSAYIQCRYFNYFLICSRFKVSMHGIYDRPIVTVVKSVTACAEHES